MHDRDRDVDRPTLRRVPIPTSGKRLPPRWWTKAELKAGTTLRAREECRQRRAARPPKRDPDVAAQREARGFALWAWANAPDCLECPSTLMH